LVGAITLDVAVKFPLPKGSPSGRHRSAGAILVPMPKAPMHENNYLVFGEHQVGLAGQFLAVNAIPKTKTMKKGANQ
jgi:hypothetical protein